MQHENCVFVSYELQCQFCKKKKENEIIDFVFLAKNANAIIAGICNGLNLGMSEFR